MLIDLLANATEGKEEQLRKIYQKAVESDERYIDLLNTLNDHQFYPGVGASLRDEGLGLLQGIMKDPQNAVAILDNMESLAQRIRQVSDQNDRLLRLPNSQSEPITVLSREMLNAHWAVLKDIASCVTFIMMLEGGMQAVETLRYSETESLQELMNTVNLDFLQKLLRTRPTEGMWAISRKGVTKPFSFTTTQYSLKGITFETYCQLIRQEGMRSINANLYIDENAYANGRFETPIYVGWGNLISERPTKCIPMLSGSVITELVLPHHSFYDQKLPVLDKALKLAVKGSRYVLKPEAAVTLMNEWEAGYVIRERRGAHKCLFCGDYVDRFMVCRRHFNI